MTNCADDFEHSSLIVQQTEIYYDVRIDTEATTIWEWHRHLFQTFSW
jgi:hypothetical protein